MFLKSRSDWLKLTSPINSHRSGRRRFEIQKNEHHFTFSPSIISKINEFSTPRPLNLSTLSIEPRDKIKIKPRKSFLKTPNRNWNRIKLEPMSDEDCCKIIKSSKSKQENFKEFVGISKNLQINYRDFDNDDKSDSLMKFVKGLHFMDRRKIIGSRSKIIKTDPITGAVPNYLTMI